MEIGEEAWEKRSSDENCICFIIHTFLITKCFALYNLYMRGKKFVILVCDLLVSDERLILARYDGEKNNQNILNCFGKNYV